ncbi:MAG: phage shock protein [Actinomycetota bacterium]|nr:phage shock protein [Actinomycetota bacterium]
MLALMWKRSAAIALVVLAGASGVTACSSSSASDSPATSASVNVAEATVIDVRTPSEYAAGHLEGAQNIDVESGAFAAQIGALPKDSAYIVYCRSGNRSAVAAAQMKDLGFTNVVDAGGLQEAADTTGLPVVQ